VRSSEPAALTVAAWVLQPKAQIPVLQTMSHALPRAEPAMMPATVTAWRPETLKEKLPEMLLVKL